MGRPFFATNRDANFKMKYHKMPGGGSMVAAIESASETSPYVVGKPNPNTLNRIL